MRRTIAALAAGLTLAVSAPVALADQAPPPPPAAPMFLPGLQLPNLNDLLGSLIPNLSNLLPQLPQVPTLPDLSSLLPNLQNLIPNLQTLIPNLSALLPNLQDLIPNLPDLSVLPALPVIPGLPATCLPPGLSYGQPIPADFTLSPNWRPSAECIEDVLDKVLPAPPAPPAETPDAPPAPEAGGTPPAPPAPPVPPALELPGFDFHKAFFTRLWNMTGEILGVDLLRGQQVLDLDVRRILTPPRVLRDDAAEVQQQGATLLVAKNVKITRNGVRIRFADLDPDDIVRVSGRFLRERAWLADDDGEKVPTFRVKRIIVS